MSGGYRYAVHVEPYVMPQVVWRTKRDGRRQVADGARFTHAIRRADGSLVYRAGSLEQARVILERLADTATTNNETKELKSHGG